MADGSGPSAFLDVSRSLTGRRWRLRPADARLANAHRLRHGLSEPMARALAARGVSEAHAGDWLTPTLRAWFPDPSSFLDMDLAAGLLLDAVVAERRCVVFADYDVDGATSAALLVRWFRAMGCELAVCVPDRLTEGYGPSPQAFRRLQAQGAELVVTVDCGAAAHDALEAAASMSLPVIVIDHHLMRGGTPPAAALVNPNRPGCGSGQGQLAAAGVVFVLLAALNREARRRGLFEARAAPDILAWLDLAALGAICDVTALTGFNRALAAQGLRVMSGWTNPGLKALLEVAQASGPATPFHAGFLLGPRINAGGRVGRSDLGARLLATDDPDEARGLAEELDALNVERKAVEAEAFAQAVHAAEHQHRIDPDAHALVVAGEGWHPGVIGIVAGRLRERWRKPVVVIALDVATGFGKGSGRSHPGSNLGRAVQAAFDAGVVLAGGGHAMAAGLTLRVDGVEAFRTFLNARLADEAGGAVGDEDFDIDALISVQAADRDLLAAFDRLQPHGPGNPEPVFAIAGVRIVTAVAMRGGHVRAEFAGEDGMRLRGVAWRAQDRAHGRRLLARDGLVHVAGLIKPDDYRAQGGVQIEIEDVADPRQAG